MTSTPYRDAEQLASRISNDASTAANRISNEVASAASVAQHKLEDGLASAKDMAAGQFDRVESAIRRNPLAAASIAGGVGFFLAVLARR